MKKKLVKCPLCDGDALVFLTQNGGMVPPGANHWAWGLGEPYKKCPLCLKRGKVSIELDSAYRLARDPSAPLKTAVLLRETAPWLFPKNWLMKLLAVLVGLVSLVRGWCGYE